ncbi:MAG TPA: DAK2 domain-containing protein [Candidatus Anaerobutyricum faecale]|nr:DAK2 domain-containing protein [Candidatus Anaerobutyricum faecale]
MGTQTIDAKAFQKLFLAGANRINEQKEYINELNVFPVPDGDTGTNMSLTILSAAREVEKLSQPTISTLCKAISGGSLRGARGNSGVILSQLFRGFTKSVSKADSLGKEEIAAGFNRAVETAYKAVMKPKEGTILTVARGMAEKASELSETDLELIPYCEEIISYGYEVLARTPEMLPVLKEAGVVDSGGQGLMEVLQGVLDALTGKVTDVVIPEGRAVSEPSAPAKGGEYVPPADIKFGYCTEFIIMLNQPLSAEEEKELKEYFLSIGDSLVLVADDDICKVHVHTNHPGQAFEKALTYGPLSNMKVDNMRLEHEEKLIKDAEKVAARQREEEALAAQQTKEPPKKIGFIAVSIGDGLSEIFKDLGVDYLIEGGQTMNPSTEDMLEAIEQVNAENIFILPNNKNIILAAEQAAKLTGDKNIIVLPTKTIPQGISAMVGYMPEMDAEENKEGMTECYQNILSGQVTYAVRDTSINGKTIRNGDIMGIDDDGIQAVGTDVAQTTLDLLSHMVDGDSELISLYYGDSVTQEQAAELAAKVEEMFPDVEIETNFGGQPIYYYMVSVE